LRKPSISSSRVAFTSSTAAPRSRRLVVS
jgi:hypothetical protein